MVHPDSIKPPNVVGPDQLPEERHTVLYMGKEKSGKTHNACSWPDPIVVAFDPNRATVRKFVEAGKCRIVELNPQDPWGHFQWGVLPAVQNGQWDCQTVVVDSWSSAFDELVLAEKKSGLEGFDLWGAVFEKGMAALKLMVSAAVADPYRPDRRTYHIVGTCHEQLKTNDKDVVIDIRPAVPGQSSGKIGKMFNTVLWCTAETSAEMVGKDTAYKTEYLCWTVPHDKFRSAGDGVGGGGKYQKLPAKVLGTYEGLMAAWQGS